MAALTVQQAFELAMARQREGRLAEAEQILREILSVQNDLAPVVSQIGLILLQTGNLPAAVEQLSRAAALAPNDAMAQAQLGAALARAGRTPEAIGAYQRALALRPDMADVHFNLGHACQQERRWEDAIHAYQRAVALRSSFAEAWNNLGNVLDSAGSADEAITAYRQSIAVKPDHAPAYLGLGNILQQRGMLSDAIAAYEQGIRLAPHLPEAHFNLGLARQSASLPDAAEADYRRALALRPDYPEALNNLGNVLQEQGDLDAAIEAYRAAGGQRISPSAHSNLLYAIHFHPAYDMPAIAAEHRRWNETYGKPLAAQIRPHDVERKKNRRLRIGYVSPHFRHHPVGRFLLPLFEHHDREAFEVVCYSDCVNPDAITQRLRSGVAEWQETSHLSDAQLADLIRADRIDILVDLSLHMHGTRMLAFARKPAPVQVTYLAYCSTSGLDVMDYRLTDPHFDPPDAPTAFYSEQSIRLPTSYWCYPPPEDAPPIAPSPAARAGCVTFGCLNNYYKLTAPTWSAWIELLRAVPNSRLLLHSIEGRHRDRDRRRLADAGIDPSRLQFVPRMLPAEYFNLYNQIDIALDTFPHGGGTTTCDALWMGVPVVTLVGKTTVSRGGLSILSNLQMPELVARSLQQYSAIASKLAGDPNRLGLLRRTLRERMRASPLMDGSRFARDVEAAFRQMTRKS